MIPIIVFLITELTCILLKDAIISRYIYTEVTSSFSSSLNFHLGFVAIELRGLRRGSNT
jgi:hypothetical protein